MNRKQRRADGREDKRDGAGITAGRPPDPVDSLALALQYYQGGGLPDAPAFVGLGNRLRDQNKLPEAAACFRQALAFRPDLVDAHNNLGGVLDLQGKLTEAIACYRRALALGPDLADVHYNLGNALREQGKPVEALAAYERAAALGQAAAQHMAAVLKKETPDRPPPEYVANLFDGYAGQFESHLVGNLGYESPKILRAMIDQQEPERRFARAVDLGCGTGLMGMAFHARVDHLTGVDLAPKMIEHSAGKGVYHRLQSAEIIEFLNQDNEKFDLFLAADVLTYLGALDGLFAAMAGCARPDARFAFSAEISTGPAYELLPSGRYAQSRPYLETQLAQVGGRALAWETHPIRIHQGKPLDGYHVVAGFNAR